MMKTTTGTSVASARAVLAISQKFELGKVFALEIGEIIDRETGLPELYQACKDVAQYLDAIQAAAEEIGEYTAIGEKLVTLKAALAKANGE